jgi:ubiquinone/menaquinone biosynthesis C-methylase UbiE
MPGTQSENADQATIEGFGAEWSKFNFAHHSADELNAVFAQYFSVFPWHELPPNAAGFDAGCGSGRWAARVAPRVGTLHCVDASEQALQVARENLRGAAQCKFHHATVDAMPFPDGSMDFGYSLGVLHHIPDTAAALSACVAKLKPGAPFMLYLYYALDGRSQLYRAIWRASDLARQRIAALPLKRRLAVTEVLAATVYWPLARGAKLLEALGVDATHVPLHYYRDKSFYVMRNDALDRFGTQLEQRYTREQIGTMMRDAGLERIEFRDGPPYWCAVGRRKR